MILPNGTFNEYDPAQTKINEGSHHFPITADYFDLISQAAINMTFEYENCDGSSKNVAPLLQAAGSIETRYYRLHGNAMLIKSAAQLLNDRIQTNLQQNTAN